MKPWRDAENEPTPRNYTKFRLLYIDAWRNDCDWTWNNWFNIDVICYPDSISNRSILKSLRDWGYLSEQSKGKIYIDDDGYNLIIKAYSNNEPLYALCYGEYL